MIGSVKESPSTSTLNQNNFFFAADCWRMPLNLHLTDRERYFTSFESEQVMVEVEGGVPQG